MSYPRSALPLLIALIVAGGIAGSGLAAPAEPPAGIPPLDPILKLPHYPVPTPNGYVVLEGLAKQINQTHYLTGDIRGGRYYPPPQDAVTASIPAQLADNRAVLAELRRALSMEWLYPHPPAPDMMFPELAKERYLGRLLVSESTLLDQKGQTQAAVKDLLDVLTLGVKLPRGGGELPWLVGAAVESTGFKELRRLTASHRLSPEVLATLPEQLNRLEGQKSPLRESIAFEYEAQGPQSLKLSAAEFWRLSGGSPEFIPILQSPGADALTGDIVPQLLPKLMAWDAQIARLSAEPYFAIRGKIAALPKDMASSDNAVVLQPVDAKTLQKAAVAQCYWRAARIMVGLELDRAVRGKYADQLSQVKGLAAEDLQDPFSGKSLIYRPQGDGYVLYSTGPDGEDHGGHRQRMPVTEGSDLMLWPDNPPPPSLPSPKT